jgi:16S rRNA (uracil1498-N3)-methyltransferase
VRIPRIHTAQRLDPGASVELEAAPSQHVARALRMPVGGELVLFDGRGGEYTAVIAAVDRRRVTVTIGVHRQIERESPLPIHLGIAVSRGERMDWVVQKGTELGVSELSPLLTERTEVKLGQERAIRKLDHWQRIAVSACEQCGRNRLPRINPPQALAQWLHATEARCRYVLHHRAAASPAPGGPPGSVALLVGPEGGLTDDEIATAEASGYRAIGLGPRILRTETAPLAALAILQARWGDMGLDRWT